MCHLHTACRLNFECAARVTTAAVVRLDPRSGSPRAAVQEVLDVSIGFRAVPRSLFPLPVGVCWRGSLGEPRSRRPAGTGRWAYWRAPSSGLRPCRADRAPFGCLPQAIRVRLASRPADAHRSPDSRAGASKPDVKPDRLGGDDFGYLVDKADAWLTKNRARVLAVRR